MKTIKFIFYFLIIWTLFSFQSSNLCDPKKLKDDCKPYMESYNYDLSKLARFTYKNKPQVKENELELYYGEKYRFVFNVSDAPIPIVISLYNKDKDHKNRKLLFTTKGEPSDKKFFTFEYTHARRVFIDYEIPADTANNGGLVQTGCVMLVLGYK